MCEYGTNTGIVYMNKTIAMLVASEEPLMKITNNKEEKSITKNCVTVSVAVKNLYPKYGFFFSFFLTMGKKLLVFLGLKRRRIRRKGDLSINHSALKQLQVDLKVVVRFRRFAFQKHCIAFACEKNPLNKRKKEKKNFLLRRKLSTSPRFFSFADRKKAELFLVHSFVSHSRGFCTLKARFNGSHHMRRSIRETLSSRGGNPEWPWGRFKVNLRLKRVSDLKTIDWTVFQML